MKKSLIITLVLVFVVGIAGTAFAAANPFVDVPANHWAYDAVAKLAKAGIVDGYSDGYFRGDRAMTRYEMAQVVAKAMARSDKADAAQKAMIDKLAVEFATELNNLGVRVTKLEQNQSPLKFGGEVMFRYHAIDFDNRDTGSITQGEYRLRLEAKANIDDQTTATLRFTSQPAKTGTDRYRYNGDTSVPFGSNEAFGNDRNTFRFDRMYLTRNLGVVKTTVGAQPLKIGAYSFIVDPDQYSFDGVKFEGKSGVVNMALNWGRFQNQVDVASFELNSNFGKLDYGAGYATLKDNGTADKDIGKYAFGHVGYLFTNKFSLGGEYVHNSASGNFATQSFNDADGNAVYTRARTGNRDKNAWFLQAVYGDQVIKNKGNQNLTFVYYKAGANSITRWSAWDYAPIIGYAYDALDLHNTKGWFAQYNYGLSKNLSTYIMYEKITDDQTGIRGYDTSYKFWRLGLTATF